MSEMIDVSYVQCIIFCVSIFNQDYVWGVYTKIICKKWYRKTFNISRTLVGNEIVDNSDVVGASPVGAAPTTSSFST